LNLRKRQMLNVNANEWQLPKPDKLVWPWAEEGICPMRRLRWGMILELERVMQVAWVEKVGSNEV
jgi:hypothetical protein